MMRHRAWWAAIFTLPIALSVFSLSLYRTSVPGCQLFSLGEIVEQAQPQLSLSLWQSLFSSGIGSARLLSLLLMAITLAVTYRLAADIRHRFHHLANPIWAMLVVVVIAVSLAFFGWMTYIASMCAAASFYILLLWRASSQRQPRLWLDAACVVVSCSLATLSLWWLLMVLSALYLLLWSPKRRIKLAVLFLLFAGGRAYLWASVGTLLPWLNLFGSFASPIPAISGAIFIFGLLCAAAWWRDLRVQRGFLAFAALLLTADFLPPLLSIITGDWIFIVMPVFVMPIGLSVWLGLRLLPLRVRLPAVALIVILLFAPRHLGVPDNDNIAQLYRQQYSSGTPLIIGFPGDYAGLAEGADIVSQLCDPPAVPVYYLINDSAFIAVTPGRAALVPIDEVRSLPHWLMIGRKNYFDQEIVSHTKQIGLNATSGLSLFVYTAPDSSR